MTLKRLVKKLNDFYTLEKARSIKTKEVAYTHAQLDAMGRPELQVLARKYRPKLVLRRVTLAEGKSAIVSVMADFFLREAGGNTLPQRSFGIFDLIFILSLIINIFLIIIIIF